MMVRAFWTRGPVTKKSVILVDCTWTMSSVYITLYFFADHLALSILFSWVRVSVVYDDYMSNQHNTITTV